MNNNDNGNDMRVCQCSCVGSVKCGFYCYHHLADDDAKAREVNRITFCLVWKLHSWDLNLQCLAPELSHLATVSFWED